ncbi:hypothetical protein [Carboxylicivirga sp. N1Y90]|uniref:hypothetical protein n=1 Tax=Carboxylicivirga fragile TaxID=3417571 RepID=UPI003D33D0B4|nr:hypothetical protein [Marinilabiliaceae bacterium N1Y90]
MKQVILLLVVSLCASVGFSQKLKTTIGEPNVIEGDKNINIVFTYNNLKVGKMEESAYVKREIKERDTKKEGTGNEWAILWKKDKVECYPDGFIKLFNKYGEKLFDATVVPNTIDSKYTIEVNTSYIEPGFNAAIIRRPSETNHEIRIYETANPDVIIHSLELEGSYSNSNNSAMDGGDYYSASQRIRESFARAAKEYCKFIYKEHIK